MRSGGQVASSNRVVWEVSPEKVLFQQRSERFWGPCSRLAASANAPRPWGLSGKREAVSHEHGWRVTQGKPWN